VREHQIVISLKPEQFQEMQKQARAAGAQSVGAFVRQNLLIFLGLEETDNTRKGNHNAPAVQADPDWTFIAGELRRLHRELKVLSSEATISQPLLSDLAGSIDSGPLLASSLGLAEAYEEPAREENFLTDGAPVSADDLPQDYEESLILPPAHGVQGGAVTPFFQTPTMPTRTPFGLSMPTGQIPLSSPYSHHTFMPNITPLPADLDMRTKLPQDAEAQSLSTQSAAETQVEAAVFSPVLPEPVPAAPPVPEPTPEKQTEPVADPTTADPPAPPPADPLPEPVSNAAAAVEQPPPPEVAVPAPTQNHEPEPKTSATPEKPRPIAPAQGAEQSGAFAPQKDDMEVLADRAFAISPRLGAIDPEVTLQPAPTRSFADTLEELLDAGLINQVMSQADEEAFSQTDDFAGEVGAPPEDYDAGEGVEVYIQEVEVPSVTDSESTLQSDNVETDRGEVSEEETPRVIDHEPPPPPKPIGGEDETNQDDPPKPPPRRKKLM